MPNELSTLCKRQLPVSSSPHSAFGNRHSDFGELSRVAFRIRPAPVLSQSKGFTLVELMISLAMVLILILGINFVFRSATDAVGAGQALNGINSDAQSAQPVLFNDLQNVSKNPPCFIISSQLVTQFLNSDDAKTSSDPTKIITDNNGGAGNGTVTIGDPPTGWTGTPPYLSPAILGPRNHRADLLKFLAHATYQRRSGNDGTYYGSETSDDAFIELGHAALPTNNLTAFYGPTSLPNSTTTLTYSNGLTVTGIPRIGAYASDWVLARRVTLLKDQTTITPTGDIYYKAIGGSNGPAPFGAGPNLTPLSYGTQDTNATASLQTLFQSSRYDLAGSTPEQFDQLISSAILGWENSGGFANTSLWWNPLVYSVQLNQTNATYPQYRAQASPAKSVLYFFPGCPQYTGLDPTATDPGLWYDRPQCNPTVQTPVTAATLAEMAPYFLQHCSQFVVEYAGDYMQQNPGTGAMTGLGPDGQIDYYLDAQGNRHIRWYGMPRSSTGVPHPGDSSGNLVLIRGFDPTDPSGTSNNDNPTYSGGTPATTPLNYFTDVIPFRDYFTMFMTGAITVNVDSPTWEVDVNFAPSRDYGAYLKPTAEFTDGRSGKVMPAFNDPGNKTVNPVIPPTPPRYVAAWHDDMPAMVRILIKVDDPNNKVKDGPWYEYVFRLK